MPHDAHETIDLTFWCELPKALGRVVNMRSVGDRIVCETSSGIPFITPLYGHNNPVLRRPGLKYPV